MHQSLYLYTHKEPPLSKGNSYQLNVPENEEPPDPIKTEAVFIPTVGSQEELEQAAQLSSLADITPRGNILASAIHKENVVPFPKGAELIYSDKNHDICGVDLRGRKVRIGSIHYVAEWVRNCGGYFHNQTQKIVEQITEKGGIALVVADEKTDLGVVYLKAA